MFLANFRVTLVTLFAVLVLLVVAFLLLGNPFAKPAVNIDLSHSSVIKEIQTLNKLETASFTIEKIVEAGQEGNVFQDLLYGDRILLVAHGKVIAGVDLSQVTADDVVIRGQILTMTLPAPTIFNSTLDNSKTTVYDRRQGFLSRGNKDLESEARRAAESSITQAACDAGILDEARTSAVERMKQLFQFAGYTSVEVNIPQGSC